MRRRERPARSRRYNNATGGNGADAARALSAFSMRGAKTPQPPRGAFQQQQQQQRNARRPVSAMTAKAARAGAPRRARGGRVAFRQQPNRGERLRSPRLGGAHAHAGDRHSSHRDAAGRSATADAAASAGRKGGATPAGRSHRPPVPPPLPATRLTPRGGGGGGGGGAGDDNLTFFALQQYLAFDEFSPEEREGVLSDVLHRWMSNAYDRGQAELWKIVRSYCESSYLLDRITSKRSLPNALSTALCCDILATVSRQQSRHKRVLNVVRDGLISAIYPHYRPGQPRSTAYLSQDTYYAVAERLQEENAFLRERVHELSRKGEQWDVFRKLMGDPCAATVKTFEALNDTQRASVLEAITKIGAAGGAGARGAPQAAKQKKDEVLLETLLGTCSRNPADGGAIVASALSRAGPEAVVCALCALDEDVLFEGLAHALDDEAWHRADRLRAQEASHGHF